MIEKSLPGRWIKLREVERRLSPLFVEASCPSRSTIIAWIEDGTLIGKQLGTGKNYYVLEASFEEFVTSLSSASGIFDG